MSEKYYQQTQYTNNASSYCLVKSKYLGKWTLREICVSWQHNLLQIASSCSKYKKNYKLDQISYTLNSKQNCVKLIVTPGKSYEIKINNTLKQVLKEIDYYHQIKKLTNVNYQPCFPKPIKIDYSYQTNKLNSIQNVIIQKKISKNLAQYERHKSYIKQSDWKRDQQNGGLILINKKNLIPDMISYTAKKAVTSSEFTNINFPTFAMKPQSVLQSYCRCLGAAPLILQKVSNDPIQRLKAFNVIVLTLSLQLNDIQKSFNPLIGQTFQGQIGGNQIYAQQISINPHISSFLLLGKNYRLYGSLQLKANIGFNQAIGVFHGQIKLQFDDGGVVIGSMPKGVITGVIFGETKFNPVESVFSYDPINKLLCSYETKKGQTMVGHIGSLKKNVSHKFEQFLQKKKYQNYKHINQNNYEKLHSKIQVVFSNSISYDGKIYFNYTQDKNLPIKMTQNISNYHQSILPSDSSHRKDIMLRGKDKIQQSQSQNDRIQKQQQIKRLIRQKNKKVVRKLLKNHSQLR